ncbi:MAG: hypothetical protein E7237_02550, partial [Sarcina sp.]|nr:hypothetical protein [Sarcina sp.]
AGDNIGEKAPDDAAAEMSAGDAGEEAAGEDLSEAEENPAETDAAGAGSAAGEDPEVLPADAGNGEAAAPSAGSGSGDHTEPSAEHASSAENTLPDVTDADASTEEVSQMPAANAQEEGGRIWFDIPDSRIYSDGTYSFPLHTEDIPGDYTVDLEFGRYGDEGLVEAYTKGVEYDFDGTTLTLYGDRLLARGHHSFGFLVEALSTGDGNPFCGNGYMFDLAEPIADYAFEQDRDLLPGWYDTVNHREPVYVENADQPDGRDLEYEVTNVSIENQDPEEAGKDVLELLFFEDEDDPSGDNYWWHYEGRNRGTAVVRVDYIDLDGNEVSYTFQVSVRSDVYAISIDTEDGSTICRPGSTIRLLTDVRHHAVEEENEGVTDGLIYEWRLNRAGDNPEPEDFASLEVDSDGRAATVTFRSMTDQEVEDEARYELSAAVSIYKDSVSEENRLDEDSIRLTLMDSYRELWPARINSGLEVGQRETVTAQLRCYPGSNGRDYDLPEGETVYYRWYYDDRAVQVFDADGRQVGNNDEGTGQYMGSDASLGVSCDFTIYRRRPWETDLFLEARWTDPEGNDHQEGRQFHLDERNYRAWLDLPDDRVYSDGTASCRVVLEGIPDTAVYGTDYDIDMVVGLWGEDGIEAPFTEGAEYTFDGTTLTIDGEKLAARGLDNDREFGAELTLIVGGEPVWVDSWDLRYKEALIEYDREWDRDLLPGWDGTVQGINHLFVENSAYPGGEELDYRVLDVELVSDTPLEGEDGPVITDFHPDRNENDPSDYWWYYRAQSRGEAVFRVTYEDLDGRDQTYEFTVRVGNDVYNVSLTSVDASYDALPGGRFDLQAEGYHEYMDEEDHYQSETDGFRYDWFFEYGEEFARLEVDPQDPSRATLFCNDLPQGQDRMWEDVRVAVRILDGQGRETSGYDARTFWISSEYCEIVPLLLDRDLDVGCSIEDQSFEVRRYRQGQDGYEVLDSSCRVQYEWYFDEDALTITETRDGDPAALHNGEAAAGSTFTIRRDRPWRTDYHIRAFWTDEDGNERDVWGSFNFRDRNYGDKDVQTISAGDITMTMFDAPSVSVTGAGEGSTLTFVSGNESVVKADSATGLLTPVAPGTAQVTVSASETDRYLPASTELTVNVTKLSLADTAVTVTPASCTYDGKKKEPAVKVTYKDRPLKKDTDYTVTYQNNVKAGTATALITGKGNCTGTVRKTFTIARAAQSLTVKAAATVDTGKTTKITASGAKETNKYTFTSSNTSVAAVSADGTVTGKKAGSVTITVATPQTANYSKGSKTLKITVRLVLKKPGNCHFVKWNNEKYNSCRIAWNKVDGATGYQSILSWTDGSHASTKILKSNVLSQDCSVTVNHVSQFKVRAFADTAAGRVYSPWSNLEYITPSPTKLTCKNASTASELKEKISWNIIYGCNGYNVFLTTNPNGTWYWNQSTSVLATSLDATITKYRGSKLKKNTRYYVRIVTRRKRNGVFCTVPMPRNNTNIGSFIIK